MISQETMNLLIKYFQDYLSSVAHIIMQLAREGGFEGGMDNASSF